MKSNFSFVILFSSLFFASLEAMESSRENLYTQREQDQLISALKAYERQSGIIPSQDILQRFLSLPSDRQKKLVTEFMNDLSALVGKTYDACCQRVTNDQEVTAQPDTSAIMNLEIQRQANCLHGKFIAESLLKVYRKNQVTVIPLNDFLDRLHITLEGTSAYSVPVMEGVWSVLQDKMNINYLTQKDTVLTVVGGRARQEKQSGPWSFIYSRFSEKFKQLHLFHFVQYSPFPSASSLSKAPPVNEYELSSSDEDKQLLANLQDRRDENYQIRKKGKFGKYGNIGSFCRGPMRRLQELDPNLYSFFFDNLDDSMRRIFFARINSLPSIRNSKHRRGGADKRLEIVREELRRLKEHLESQS